MALDDKELFESTLTDTPVETTTDEAPVETTPETTEEAGQPRDDKGRFAPKAEEPETPPVAETPVVEAPPPAQQQTEAAVPSWRLREEREAREAAERRASEAESYWQRQVKELQARIPQQPAPDMFENPQGFVDHGVRQAVDPIKNEIGQLREFYSRRDAERDHGAEKVKAAYEAIAQGLAHRDPEAIATYQRAMSSMHPYGDIVQWHQQRTVYSQIGNDPNVWFEKQMSERIKDPAYQAKLMQQIQASTSQTATQRQTSIVQLPPSLNKVASAQSSLDGDDDVSDAGLFRHATR